MDEPASGGFLPPEPAGRAPDLSSAPAPPPPAPAWQQQQSQGWQQPPGVQQPQGWQQPPVQQWPQTWQAAPAEPDNGPAVAGFAFSISSMGLLVVSVSLSTLLSLGLGIAGIVQSRKGRRLVDEGRTRKHKDIATAGFVVGIISTVLSAAATLFWIGIVILIATDESARRDFQDQLDDQGEPAVVQLALVGARLLGVALS